MRVKNIGRMAGGGLEVRRKGEYVYFLPVITLALYLTAMPGHGDSTRGHGEQNIIKSLFLLLSPHHVGSFVILIFHPALKFNRSHFLDLTDPCSRYSLMHNPKLLALTNSLTTVLMFHRTGSYETILNRTHPAALLKLDIRYKTLVTYQSFDCIIKVQITLCFYVIRTL